MHSGAYLWCIQCHVNHMTSEAQNKDNPLIHLFVGYFQKRVFRIPIWTHPWSASSCSAAVSPATPAAAACGAASAWWWWSRVSRVGRYRWPGVARCDQMFPGGDQVLPDGDQMFPSGDQVLPPWLRAAGTATAARSGGWRPGGTRRGARPPCTASRTSRSLQGRGGRVREVIAIGTSIELQSFSLIVTIHVLRDLVR